MKRRGRRKAVKWYYILAKVTDPAESSQTTFVGLSRKHFREMYGSIIVPKPFNMPRWARGQSSITRSFSRWDYCVFGETADGKTIYLYSDLPPKRYK